MESTTATKHSDEVFMLRALELAIRGRGHVSPNPMVGCVIVNDGKIIGEGWHKTYGEAHAEVNAVNSVADKSLLANSTVYVNLEPCSHIGKTPPCADLLIRENIKKVIVANIDSNPLVGGKGIKKLQAAGVTVTTGVLEKRSRELNNRFFTFIEKNRPYIILKWAETADGFIARNNYDSKWISDEYSRQLVHRWRAEEDAILVGSGTALHDNPALNVRDWTGRNPTRIIIDRFLKIPSSYTLFDRSQKTICYNVLKTEKQDDLEFVKLEEHDFIKHLIHNLSTKKIQSIIVEGGAQILQAFIEANLWDEARIFTSPTTFGVGISAPIFSNAVLTEQHQLKSDLLRIYSPNILDKA
jgi:diaminohydroxyphosphoribosylaminopyrimidine deaminase/5-amino-6-(5-phosphoribosylamino)uracil reductase